MSGWRTLFVVAVAGLSGDWVGTGFAQGTWPTPEIDEIVALEEHAGAVHFMRAELGDSGIVVGLGLVCVEEGGEELAVEVYFGGFPGDRRPVQLAVRTEEGTVERFGPVVTGGPESGFHSPRVVEAAEVRRFVGAAIREGSLVSNGYRSFWNRVSEERNNEVRELFLRCLDDMSELKKGGLRKPERLGLGRSLYRMVDG